MKTLLYILLVILLVAGSYPATEKYIEYDVGKNLEMLQEQYHEAGLSMGYEAVNYSLRHDRTTLKGPWLEIEGYGKLDIREVVIHDIEFIETPPILSRLNVEIIGLQGQKPPTGISATMDAMVLSLLGEGSPILNARINSVYDAEAKIFDMSQFELHVEDMGKIGLEVKLGNVAKIVMTTSSVTGESQTTALYNALQNLTFHSASWRYRDEGLLPAALQIAAEKQDLEPEAFRAQLIDSLRLTETQYPVMSHLLPHDDLARLLRGDAKQISVQLNPPVPAKMNQLMVLALEVQTELQKEGHGTQAWEEFEKQLGINITVQ